MGYMEADSRGIAPMHIVRILAFVTRIVIITNLFLFHAPQFSACAGLSMHGMMVNRKKERRKQAQKLGFFRALSIKIKRNDDLCNEHKIYVAEIIFNRQPEQV